MDHLVVMPSASSGLARPRPQRVRSGRAARQRSIAERVVKALSDRPAAARWVLEARELLHDLLDDAELGCQRLLGTLPLLTHVRVVERPQVLLDLRVDAVVVDQPAVARTNAHGDTHARVLVQCVRVAGGEG